MKENREETESGSTTPAAKSGMERRDFLKTGAAGAVTSLALGCATSAETTAGGGAKAAAAAPAFIRKIGPSDEIRLGYVGVGVRGKQHMRFSGFPHPDDNQMSKDATKNLPRKLNVRAVAMSDLYEGNRQWASEAVPGIKTYENYEELLENKDVDAVFIGTSDHYHAPVGMDACMAGKHVYSEKPFTHKYDMVKKYRDVVKKSGVVFQLGHQTRSGTLMEKGRKALGGIGPDGKIGKVSLIEIYTNRNNANGAWIYKIPTEASANNINWKKYQALSPDRPFDLDRFFRFRKYWDYGTGQSGDLLSHEMDAVQQLTGLGIPDTAVSTGGVYFHHDGRETPDVYQVAFTYEKEQLLVNYNGTLANARHRERTLFGHDGTLDMSFGINMVADQFSDKYADMIDKGEWSIPTGMADEAENLEKIKAMTNDSTQWMAFKGIYMEIIDGKEVNVTGLHVLNFVESIREPGKYKPACDIDMAFEEGVIVHMANEAYHRGRRVRWDHVREEIVNDNA